MCLGAMCSSYYKLFMLQNNKNFVAYFLYIGVTPHWECTVAQSPQGAPPRFEPGNSHTAGRHVEKISYATPIMSYAILLMSYVIPIERATRRPNKKIFDLDKTECTSISVVHTFSVQLRLGDFPSAQIFSQFFK